MNRVEDFQQHSQKLLSEEMPSASELQDLLDVSFEFDVELPQLAEMRVRLEQAHWLEEVQQAEWNHLQHPDGRHRGSAGVGTGQGPSSSLTRSLQGTAFTPRPTWGPQR